MKLKSSLFVLLAAGIIALGAWLPELVERRQDMIFENQVQFAAVEAVELEFAQSDMTRSQMLAILCAGKGAVEIPEELASLKRDKVEKIVFTTAEKYADAGILLSDITSDEILYCQTLLLYGQDNQSNVYWYVQYGDREGKHCFSLTIDDRTGIVCAAEYADFSGEYLPEQMEAVFTVFTQQFLTGLGEEFFDYPVGQLLEEAKTPQDRSYLASEFSWDDPLYGHNQITFFVNRTGFYTYLGSHTVVN